MKYHNKKVSLVLPENTKIDMVDFADLKEGDLVVLRLLTKSNENNIGDYALGIFRSVEPISKHYFAFRFFIEPDLDLGKILCPLFFKGEGVSWQLSPENGVSYSLSKTNEFTVQINICHQTLGHMITNKTIVLEVLKSA